MSVCRSFRVLTVIVAVLFIGCRTGATRPEGTVATTAAADSSPAPAGRGLASGGASKVSWSGTQTVQVQDANLGITALTMQIPSGWKFAGIIARPSGCHSMGPSLDYTAVAQDGITALINLPGVIWTSVVSGSAPGIGNGSKCPPLNVQTPAEFLLNVAIPNLHPGATVEAVLPLLPEGAASLQKQLAAMQQQNETMQFRQFQAHNITLDGARVRVAYAMNGTPVEEMITAVVTCRESALPTGVLRGPAPVVRNCTERGTNIIRAPKGQLDTVMGEPSVKNLLASVKVSPEWQQRMQQEMVNRVNAQRDADNRMFQNYMTQERTQFNQSIANDRQQDAMRAQGTERAMAADRANQDGIDYAAHRQVNLSLGRQDFTDPNTGRTVTLSNEYNHQWMSSDGQTAVQANDPGFDPNREMPFSGPFTELVPK